MSLRLKHLTRTCPRCDPSVILGHSERPDSRPHCCYSFTVFHSPHSKGSITTADDILPIRCSCHCSYATPAVDFDERGTLSLSKISINATKYISPVRTSHCPSHSHQRHNHWWSNGERQRTSCFLHPLPFIDIDQWIHSITWCSNFTRAMFPSQTCARRSPDPVQRSPANCRTRRLCQQ